MQPVEEFASLMKDLTILALREVALCENEEMIRSARAFWIGKNGLLTQIRKDIWAVRPST